MCLQTHTAFLCFLFSDWPYMFTNTVGPHNLRHNSSLHEFLTTPLQHSFSRPHIHPQSPTTVPQIFMRLSLSPELCYPARSGIHRALTWSPTSQHQGQQTAVHRSPWKQGGGGYFSLLFRPPVQECSGSGLPGRESNPPGHPTPAAKAPASVG